MNLAVFVLRCFPAPRRPAHSRAAARRQHHAPGIAAGHSAHRLRHPLSHALTAAHGGCRYVPLVLGTLIGPAAVPAIAPAPAQSAPPAQAAAPVISPDILGPFIVDSAFLSTPPDTTDAREGTGLPVPATDHASPETPAVPEAPSLALLLPALGALACAMANRRTRS